MNKQLKALDTLSKNCRPLTDEEKLQVSGGYSGYLNGSDGVTSYGTRYNISQGNLNLGSFYTQFYTQQALTQYAQASSNNNQDTQEPDTQDQDTEEDEIISEGERNNDFDSPPPPLPDLGPIPPLGGGTSVHDFAALAASFTAEEVSSVDENDDGDFFEEVEDRLLEILNDQGLFPAEVEYNERRGVYEYTLLGNV